MGQQSKIDALNLDQIVDPIPLAEFIDLGMNRPEYKVKVGRTELFRLGIALLFVVGCSKWSRCHTRTAMSASDGSPTLRLRLSIRSLNCAALTLGVPLNT